MQIQIEDFSGPEIAQLLAEHLADMRATSPPESKHALDMDGLRDPTVTAWSVWEEGRIAGCVALKELEPGHGEIKSMRTSSEFRNRGVASRLLNHLLQEADGRQYHRLSLETGSMAFFLPARQLYEKFGFEYCGPFAGYCEDPNSVFMTRLFPQANTTAD